MHRFAFAVAGAPIIGGTLALALAPTLHRGVIRPLDDEVYATPYGNGGRVANPSPTSAAPTPAQGNRNRNDGNPPPAGSPSGIDSDRNDTD